jgi:hypothetical protein
MPVRFDVRVRLAGWLVSGSGRAENGECSSRLSPLPLWCFEPVSQHGAEGLHVNRGLWR